ncbi:MAG: protease pro-enzyme activation domain-containing protein [Candidatus Dormibacteria bacterium]
MALLASAILAGAVLIPAAPVLAQPTDPFLRRSGDVQLSSDVLNHLDQLTPTGAYDPSAPLTIGFQLTRPDPGAENAYLADAYNAASPNFHHFVDVAGFRSRFGVSDARQGAALAWLRAHGLTTERVSGSTEYFLATGPAAAIESMLRVDIKTYTALGTSFYANVQAPTVPANLGVIGISGLESWSRMKTMHEWQKSLPASPRSVAVPSSTSIGNTTPQDLWSIYNQPAGNTGQGEDIAIFGWGATSTLGVDVVSNLRKFEATYKLPQVPVTIDHFGPASEQITDKSGTPEWNLDLPASTGMAPGINRLHLYFGKSGADPDILAAYAGWNGDASGPRQGSSSFAGCEASPLTGSQPGGPANPPTQGGPAAIAIGNPNQDGYEALLKATVMLGRTMFVSAGDLGANGCPYSFTTALNGVTAVPTGINNYPSVSPYVTAVGGTVLYWTTATATTPATRFLEYSWTHTGGGTSLYIAAPDFQKSIPAPGLLFPCVTDWHNPPNPYAPGTLCRGIPDVAAQSGDIISNGYVAGAGTSLSSPLWVGMWSRIQAASSNPARNGFASVSIYQNNADSTRWARDFFDVGGISTTTVPSCTAGPPTPYNCSAPGWDYLSGWGTPNVTNLMKDLDGGNTAPVSPRTTAASSSPVTPTITGGGSPNTSARAPLAAWLLLLAGLAAVAWGLLRHRAGERIPLRNR